MGRARGMSRADSATRGRGWDNVGRRDLSRRQSADVSAHSKEGDYWPPGRGAAGAGFSDGAAISSWPWRA